MKKVGFLGAALIVMLFLLAGCGTKQDQSATTEQKLTTTTLMIYMVGSDLEPKAGAASADLQEIASSGIDLTQNKVVVCAGGSPRWHDEQLNAEKVNILTLKKEGFSQVSLLESQSMGEAQTLEKFLNYCWENYPSDEFALILWDHGNGPVMGYGKDILHNNDALLLTEMEQALSSTEFSKENKLAWVGFDACLMASAELSCLLADYADYLVASQEIEPSFGWDYKFLAQLGKTETPQLLQKIIEDYMAACQAYYTRRNYDYYDVTLSVVDLSRAEKLEEAINTLFSAASEEVSHYYDLFAANRLQSRALGRATTGSEYDLVDLKDMTMRLSALFPEQTKALMDIVDSMVLANVSSIEGSCGMSLYYPFYNKRYYEKNWKSVYTELGLFDAYQDYLSVYEQTWLKEDKLELKTQEVVPEQTAERTYRVTLGTEQAKTFGSAEYHILKRISGDIYQKVYSSRDVVWENNTLTAVYDGMAIYVRSTDGSTFIPPTAAVDSIDQLYRYSGIFALSNGAYKPEDISDDALPEESVSRWRYLLTLNRRTGKVEMSGTVPYTEDSDQLLTEYGRIAEADLSLYGSITFMDAPSGYITRYENGVIKPLDQWYKTNVLTGYELPLAEGYSFEHSPLAGGEYYLIFEITDTQSMRYCSELLPITVENVPQPEINLPVTEIAWKENEERLLLKEAEGMKLYLITRDTESNGTRYFLEMENANDYAVKITVGDLTINETLLTDRGMFVTAKPYDFMYEELQFGEMEGTGVLERLTSLQFSVYMEKARSGAPLSSKEILKVNMAKAPTIDIARQYRHYMDYDLPYMGATADKQVVYESEDMRLTLMGLGNSSQNSLIGSSELLFYAENLSQRRQNVGVYGLVINGYFVEAYGTEVTLPGGRQTYFCVNPDISKLEFLGFDQIHSLSVLVATSERRLWWMNETECLWCPVKLEQVGVKQTCNPGELLWEERGVRVSIYKEDIKEKTWYLLIENNSDWDLCLEPVNVFVNGVAVNPYEMSVLLSGGKTGVGQKTICSLVLYDSNMERYMPEELIFDFQIRTFDETKVLYTATESTKLSVE